MRIHAASILAICALNLVAADHPLLQCSPSPAWKTAAASLAVLDDLNRDRDARTSSLRALLASRVDDIWLEMAWQDTFRDHFYLEAEFDAALSRYEKGADSALAQFLRGRLLLFVDQKRAAADLESLSKKFPGSPWVHIALLELLNYPYLSDDAKAARHAAAVLDGCPDALPVYGLLNGVSDQKLLQTAATLLRSRLQRDINYANLGYWPVLWALESRIVASTPVTLKARKTRVVQDLAMLSVLPPAPSGVWIGVMEEASEAAQDPLIVADARARLKQRYPFSAFAQHPDAPDFWKRISLPPLRNAPVPERLAALDEYLSLTKRSPELAYSVPPLAMRVAELYLDWRARLDQAPGLIDAGLETCRRQHRYQPKALDAFQRPMPGGGPGCPIRSSEAKAAELRARLASIRSERPANPSPVRSN